MDLVNRVITFHKYVHPEKNLLLDHHWEVYDPILTCPNQEKLLTFYSTQSDVYFQKFKVWESCLPLCIIPQVFHFLDLIDSCVSHYSFQTKSIITQITSQIFITVTVEEIIKMLGLNSTNFSEKNVISLSEEIMIQKFTSLSSQEQLAFFHIIHKPKELLQVMKFPLRA